MLLLQLQALLIHLKLRSPAGLAVSLPKESALWQLPQGYVFLCEQWPWDDDDGRRLLAKQLQNKSPFLWHTGASLPKGTLYKTSTRWHAESGKFAFEPARMRALPLHECRRVAALRLISFGNGANL